ncbi:hypothetical protein GCM10009504_27040 [Pseudomonas laurentiana]|uniref:Uncharacterized protein n=1 Tax=Pseudomonas laurentiana TaxID=2364649 RepID=A0A6I5RTW7_9PSED|nr:hypothetical protein [Pseudomonas laurentiana]NES11076.1 hypothetical protein [Pseudomonas laurentiana]GGU68477.1 hypothetical protein GCM10009504_27040 [Pseudomonas laurentiana]
MQQNYILALATLWLFTLAILPFLFSVARRRAFENGLTAGKVSWQAVNNHHIKALEKTLADKVTELEDAKQNFTQAMNARRDVIAELEARIMSYTGLAVTKLDHEQLTKAAETLQLAQRTWETAKGTEPWCVRAHNERLSIQALARRIHEQLRTTPASAAKAGEAA